MCMCQILRFESNEVTLAFGIHLRVPDKSFACFSDWPANWSSGGSYPKVCVILSSRRKFIGHLLENDKLAARKAQCRNLQNEMWRHQA